MDDEIAIRMSFHRIPGNPEFSACAICGDHVQFRTTDLAKMRGHVYRVHENDVDEETKQPGPSTSAAIAAAQAKRESHWFMGYFEEKVNDAVCKLCKSFSQKKTRYMALRKHLEHCHTTQFQEHEMFIRLTKKSENENSASEQGSSSNESDMIDDIISKFFAKNGLPSDTIRDSTFMQLIYCLNKDYLLPTPKTIDNMQEVIAIKSRKFDTEEPEPSAVTVDIVKNNNVLFLAFSVHGYDKSGLRVDSVHLRKLRSVAPIRVEIMDEMKKAVDEVHYSVITFSSLVTSTHEIERLLYITDSVKKSYVCFYTYICKFVTDLLSIPEIDAGVRDLVQFVATIRNTYYNKFIRYLSSRNIIYELPDLPNDDWREINFFLMRVFQNHTNFEQFDQLEHTEAYISNNVYTELMRLHRVLTILEDSMKFLSKPGVSISTVLPELLKIKFFISKQTSRSGYKKAYGDKFSLHFDCFFDGFRENHYAFATFLDPRYSYAEELKPIPFWKGVEKLLIEDIVTNYVPYQYSDMPQLFRKVLIREMGMFMKEIDRYRPAQSINPFDWWSKNKEQFPILCNRARSALAPPPTAIDGLYYFGDKGKFGNFPKSTSAQVYNNQLRVAASLQKFRGRGANVEQLKLEMFTVPTNEHPSVSKTVLPPRFSKSTRKTKANAEFNPDCPSTSTEPVAQQNSEMDNSEDHDAALDSLLDPDMNTVAETNDELPRRINEQEISRMLMEPPENAYAPYIDGDVVRFPVPHVREIKKEEVLEETNESKNVPRINQIVVPKIEVEETVAVEERVIKTEVQDESEPVAIQEQPVGEVVRGAIKRKLPEVIIERRSPSPNNAVAMPPVARNRVMERPIKRRVVLAPPENKATAMVSTSAPSPMAALALNYKALIAKQEAMNSGTASQGAIPSGSPQQGSIRIHSSSYQDSLNEIRNSVRINGRDGAEIPGSTGQPRIIKRIHLRPHATADKNGVNRVAVSRANLTNLPVILDSGNRIARASGTGSGAEGTDRTGKNSNESGSTANNALDLVQVDKQDLDGSSADDTQNAS